MVAGARGYRGRADFSGRARRGARSQNASPLRCVLRRDVQPDEVASVRERHAHRPRVQRAEEQPLQVVPRASAPFLQERDARRQLGRRGHPEPGWVAGAQHPERHAPVAALGRLGEGTVEGGARRGRPVAETGFPGPEIDAGRSLRGRVGTTAREGGPAPRPHGGQAQLAGDLSRGQRLALDDLEPRRRSQAHAATAAGLEAESDADPGARDTDRRQVAHGAPQLEPHVDARSSRPERVQPRSRQVQLADDRCDLRQRAPPVPRGAAGGAGLRDEELRLGTVRGQALHEGQHVGAVTGSPRPPRRRALGLEELVQADHGRRAAGDAHGVFQHACRCSRNRPRVGRFRRRADSAPERHVPEGELRAAPARVRGRRVVRQRDRQPRLEEEAPERHPLVAVVDPGGLRRLATRRRA